MTDRYAVIGNPIAHSRSPSIHAQFARQTGEDIRYERLLAPRDAFAASVDAFRASGGRGLNVTLPFKIEAYGYANRRAARAQAAGAVNTLAFDGETVLGDNTDGAGMVRDIVQRQRLPLAGCRVLLAGAGGAARGVLLPLLEAGVDSVLIANRTVARAIELAERAADPRVRGCSFDAIESMLPAAADSRAPGFELIVNATSAGLDDAAPPLPQAAYRGAQLAFDMVYGARPTRFIECATAQGCARACDGLGMLVEQAAESFFVWRGLRPETDPVYRRLRAEIAGA